MGGENLPHKNSCVDMFAGQEVCVYENPGSAPFCH